MSHEEWPRDLDDVLDPFNDVVVDGIYELDGEHVIIFENGDPVICRKSLPSESLNASAALARPVPPITIDDDEEEDEVDDESTEFTIVKPDQLMRKMKAAIDETCEVVCDLPKAFVKKLLAHLAWDKERLFEVMFQDVSSRVKSKLLTDAGIKDLTEVKARVGDVDSSQNCEICLDKFEYDESLSSYCGHAFCGDCWGQFLNIKLKEDGLVDFISCPAENCEIPVEDDLVLRFATSSEAQQRFNKMLTNSFVEQTKKMKWCPGADCNNAIQLESGLQSLNCDVICICGSSLCFSCDQDAHGPLSCVLLQKWKRLCKEDAATSAYMMKNTVKCPHCQISTQKISGCNHMTCTKCRGEFCWLCGNDWRNHAACNQVKRIQGVEKDEQVRIERFNHCHSRYIAHCQSLKLEKILIEKLNEYQKMHWLGEHEFAFLHKTLELLYVCRQVLMSSYAFVYYLISCNELDLFEYNQSFIEKATEALSRCLEEIFDPKDEDNKPCEREKPDLGTIKSRLMDKFKFCQSRKKLFIEHMNDGIANNWWKYI